MVKDTKTWGVSIKNFSHAWQILGVKEEMVVVLVVVWVNLLKREILTTKMFYNFDNFELSSREL